MRDLIPEETMGWLKERIKIEIEKEKHRRVDDLGEIGKEVFNEQLETFFIEKDEIVFDFNTRFVWSCEWTD